MGLGALLLTPRELLAVSALALFSLADLRYRTVPGVRIFFLAAVVFGLSNPLQTLSVLLAVGWGRFPKWRAWVILPAILHPAAWPVLLVSVGVRNGRVSFGDLFAIGGIACLFDWQASFLALIGAIVSLVWWKHRQEKTAPGVPGLFCGFVLYQVLQTALVQQVFQ